MMVIFSTSNTEHICCTKCSKVKLCFGTFTVRLSKYSQSKMTYSVEFFFLDVGVRCHHLTEGEVISFVFGSSFSERQQSVDILQS